MVFSPHIDQELLIEKTVWHIAAHPWAPETPYGQEGRQATVYQLVSGAERRALKVFHPRYRLPEMTSLAERIAPLAGLSGLQVCQRTVLTPQRHAELLRQYPDLTYAVLMPWVEGPTWMEVVAEKQALSPEESLKLARSLCEILAGMEQKRLAHCDLSGPNVMLSALVQAESEAWQPTMALVDVEQLYRPNLERPELLPAGSPGYGHRTVVSGAWGATADRFAGAVLLAEMLGWWEERVRAGAWGESVFEPQEMQRDSERYRLLAGVLGAAWGEKVVGLFARAWQSEVLAACPTFGEWLVTLPDHVPPRLVPESQVATERTEEPTVISASEAVVRALMAVAQRLEEQGNPGGALENYRQARSLAGEQSELARELELIIRDLEQRDTLIKHPESLAPTPAPVIEQDSEEPDEDRRPPVSEVDSLYLDGLAAYQRQEWARARELLGEVARQQPGYQVDGNRVDELLAEIPQQSAPRRRRRYGWVWVVLVVGLIGVLIAGIGVARTNASSARMSQTATAQAETTTAAKATEMAYRVEQTLQVGVTAIAAAQKTKTPTPTAQSLPTSTRTPRPTSTVVQKSTPTRTLIPTMTRSSTRTPTPAPTLPPTASNKFLGVQVLYHDDFERLAFSQWEWTDVTIKASNGLVEIPGQSAWSTAIWRTKHLDEKSAVLVLLKYDAGALFEVFLDSENWQMPGYKRWGVYMGTEFHMNIFGGDGYGDSLSGNLGLKPDTLYYLLLTIGPNSRCTVSVWEKTNPVAMATYQRQFDSDWTDKDWLFTVGAYQGRVYVDTVTIFSFDLVQ